MKKKLLVIGLLAALVLAAAGGRYVFGIYSQEKALKEKQQQLAAYQELRQSGEVSAMYNADGNLEVPVDFQKLQEENPDIYAWITIPGVVDEPVLQHADDDTYYTSHGADGAQDAQGAVFTESLNTQDFSDPLTVMYGMNSEDGSLFGSLFQYRDRQFMEEHPKIYIYTPERVLIYQIFAAYRSDNRHLLMRFNQGTYEGNVRAFIKDILSQREMDATIIRDVEIDTNDRFLTLSTHDREGEEYRYLVQGYFLEERT